MSAANDLTRQIIKYIFDQGGFAWRQNTTGIIDPIRGYRPAAKKGVADILCCFKGKSVAIEVKIGKDRLSDEQIGFLKSIEATGGISMVVGTFDDFLALWLDNIKKYGL